jgi:hypothetical protein
MSAPEQAAAEAAPTHENAPAEAAAPAPVEPSARQEEQPADDKWRAKYERADRHLNDKIEALKAAAAEKAELEQKLEAMSAAKAEAEANARKVEELQKQLHERDFQDRVLTGVAPGKIEAARVMLRGLGIDPTADNAAELAAEQIRKISPDIYASAPVRSANTDDNAMLDGLKGKTWHTLSADERKFVVRHPRLTKQLNDGRITHPHPPKEKHRR